MDRPLSEAQRERYDRQLVLEEVGEEGQRKLLAARVLVVGAGGLGSSAALNLAAAGVGTLGVVDDDAVELSNLQRQLLYATAELGQAKVACAARRLTELNADVTVVQHPLRLTAASAAELVRAYDLVVDAVDNPATRYAVNEACVAAGKTLVEAGVLRFNGLLTTIRPGEGPCYHCLFPDPPAEEAVPTTRQFGVLGAVAGVLGTLEAVEALNLILGIGEPLVGRVLVYEGRTNRFREVPVARRPGCPVCAQACVTGG